MSEQLLRNLYQAPLADTKEVTFGQLEQGLYYFDVVSTILHQTNDDNVIQELLQEAIDVIEREQVTSLAAPTLVFYLSGFKEYEKYYFEKLDLGRSIANDTFSSEVCRVCKKNKTRVVVVQIRSSDEPATKFVTCLDKECGVNYKTDE